MSTSSDTIENASVEPVLPSPAELPQADVVIFDGQCRFCRASVARLHRLDGRDRLAFISLHDPEVARRYPDLSHDELMQNMYVVDRRGKRYYGAAALRYLSRRLPRMWWAAPALHVPLSLPVWQYLYQHVARRRYLFGRVQSCDGGACQLPRR